MAYEKCDYCHRKAIGWMSYEGLHRVCRFHRKIIEDLAKEGLLGIKFQSRLEASRPKEAKDGI